MAVAQIIIQKRMLRWLPRFLDNFREEGSVQGLSIHGEK